MYASVRPDPKAPRRRDLVMYCVLGFQVAGTTGALVTAIFSGKAALVVAFTCIPLAVILGVVALIMSARSPRSKLSKALDIPDFVHLDSSPDGYRVFCRPGLPFDQVWVVEENFSYGWAFEAQGLPAAQGLR